MVCQGHVPEPAAVPDAWPPHPTIALDCFADVLSPAPFEKLVIFTNHPTPMGAQRERVEGTKWAPIPPDQPA